MSLPRALPAARVLTALELARTGLTVGPTLVESEPEHVLDVLLEELGVPALVVDELRLDLAVALVEHAEQYDRLERGGTAELDDDLPPGVSRARVRDAELERHYGDAAAIVDQLAAALR